jgi:hypothetical protein
MPRRGLGIPAKDFSDATLKREPPDVANTRGNRDQGAGHTRSPRTHIDFWSLNSSTSPASLSRRLPPRREPDGARRDAAHSHQDEGANPRSNV